jgi:hypothetical protein
MSSTRFLLIEHTYKHIKNKRTITFRTKIQFMHGWKKLKNDILNLKTM